MNSTFNLYGPAMAGRSLLALLFVMAQVAVQAASLELQGQSKGCGNWISGNLRHWQELDFIPCRILVSGKAAMGTTIELTFPDSHNTQPGFESLVHFTTSENVSIVSGPTFSASIGGIQSCTFKFDFSGEGDGIIRFLARLAPGAHLNPGDSLMLRGGPSLGNLQIHTPAPRSHPAAVGPGQRIDRCLKLWNGCFQVEFMSLGNQLYYIEYSSDLQSWRTVQGLVAGNGMWVQWADEGPPATESHPATQPMRFYRAFLIPNNSAGCPNSREGMNCRRHAGN
jgi:hypothetical protein